MNSTTPFNCDEYSHYSSPFFVFCWCLIVAFVGIQLGVVVNNQTRNRMEAEDARQRLIAAAAPAPAYQAQPPPQIQSEGVPDRDQVVDVAISS